jgi:DNA-binding response OmpR family regulator
MTQRQRRITVVDDSPELLGLFGDVLRVDGVELSLFNGATTVQDIEESVPDLLVMGLRLADDGLSGLDMIRLVRSHRRLRRVPIIVCSGALDQVRQHGDELSQVPDLFVLTKPFSLEELESCVGEALREDVGARDEGQSSRHRSARCARG